MNKFNHKIIFSALLCWTSLHASEVPVQPIKNKVPIVYHKDYNISFFGIEKMHPFDTQKYGKIAQHLEKSCGILSQDLHKPEKVTDELLREVHSSRYLKALKSSSLVARIAEVSPLRFVPNFLLQRNMLSSMRYATGGTILGTRLAMEKGWAINLGGGYHHAKANGGEGFCFFADIPLAIKKLRETHKNLKVLVVDLDAHQGNGLEAILGSDSQTAIFDMYSKYNYPSDHAVRQYIDFDHPLQTNIKDEQYLALLKRELPKAIAATRPDLIIYNAGSDVYEKDPLGKMRITKEGIIERDAFLFAKAFANKKPILMTLSGGYSPESAEIVGSSIENVLKRFNLINMAPAASIQALASASKFSKLGKKIK